jgi:arylsulfatase A-like enzyme
VAATTFALASLLCLAGCGPKGRSSDQPNLLLIVIDTARADHFGCYGYDRPTSPRIDGLAGTGTLFGHAVSQSSWTLPATACILTGLYSTRHLAINPSSSIPLWRDTLAEVLQERGYRTGAVVSHVLVSSKYNFDQGFQHFDESNLSDPFSVTSPEVTDGAIRWLKKNRRDPFFLFLHYFDPHHVYNEHPGFEFSQVYNGWVDPKARLQDVWSRRWHLKTEDLDYIRALYDSELAFTDHHIGRVLDELQRLGLEESTIVAITADHGEEFMEHGWLGHTRHLYEETIHVPLIVRDPTRPNLPSRLEAAVELTDLMPTLVEMLGVSWDGGGVDGQSLLPYLQGGAPPDTVLFSEFCERPVAQRVLPGESSEGTGTPYGDLRSMQTGRWKIVYNAAGDTYEVYDLVSDPGETVNLNTPESKQDFGVLRESLIDWMTAIQELALAESEGSGSIITLDPETEERLRALGYIQ